MSETNKRPLIGSPPWTPEEDEQLRALAVESADVKAIARHFHRSEAAVRSRAHKLGIPLAKARSARLNPKRFSRSSKTTYFNRRGGGGE